MSFNHSTLLGFAGVIIATTVAGADEPSPRLAAMHQLGRQNLSSITSDPRLGGPQGISVHELPAASAWLQAQKVDAIYAVRAGSPAAIPRIELAHPSHIPGVPGSRPFVSEGPISRSPGSNRRNSSPYPYSQVSQSSAPSAQSAPARPQPTTILQPRSAQPVFTTSVQRHSDLPGASGRL